MTVRVAISDPCLLLGLAETLEGNACVVRPLSDRVLELTTTPHGEGAETRIDLEFFLRAWQNAHPGVDLLLG